MDWQNQLHILTQDSHNEVVMFYNGRFIGSECSTRNEIESLFKRFYGVIRLPLRNVHKSNRMETANPTL